MSNFRVLGIGAIYEDVMLTIPHFPDEDSKLRATSRKNRLGGNVPNTLAVLSQIFKKNEELTKGWGLYFMGALGDKDSSAFLEKELGKRHIVPLILNRTECKTTPTAYILESGATYTRTIISYNEVTDLNTDEMRSLIYNRENSYGEDKVDHFPSWIHIEGRNCKALPFQILSNICPYGLISIDFERPGREGLRGLFSFANVAFISKNYASYISMQGSTSSPQNSTNIDVVRGALRGIGKELKETAVGYITVGSDGCYVFVSQKSAHAPIMAPAGRRLLEDGWLFAHLPASGGNGPVVETTGAGDTFIAAVIYGLGVLKLDPVQAGKLGNVVAGKKCLQEGYEDVWKDVKFPPQ